MRKLNLKILSLCVMAAGVLGLQSGVDAANVCTSAKFGHATQQTFCSAQSCKHAAGLKKCRTYCSTDEEILATHPNCAKAAGITASDTGDETPPDEAAPEEDAAN